MLRIAIVEDEKEQVDLLGRYINKFAEENDITVDVDVFEDGQDIAAQYQKKYDILLLDIKMKHLDGMQAAEIIREKDEDVIIIFITNYIQYAIKGYSVNAMDFVVKPITYATFCEKMQRALKRINKRKPKFINIKTNQGLIHLEQSEITYIETIHRKLAVHTKDQVYFCNLTMKSLEKELNGGRFFRCHVGYLVNLKYVEKVLHESAIVAGKEVFVSRHRRKDFLNALTNYMGEELL